MGIFNGLGGNNNIYEQMEQIDPLEEILRVYIRPKQKGTTKRNVTPNTLGENSFFDETDQPPSTLTVETATRFIKGSEF